MRALLIVAGMALFFASSAPGQPVASYITETVSIPNGGLTLRAVLGRPVGAGPFPVYIHNHGSMTAREAGRGPWTFITKNSLPDALAHQGYVALVLARRGYRGSDGAAATYTQNQTSGGYSGRRAADVMRGAEEETGDVVAALEYLQSLPYVDREHVAVGGVSLGGLVSTMAARHDSQGLHLDARTTCAGWLGERLNVGWAIDVLHPLAQGARPNLS